MLDALKKIIDSNPYVCVAFSGGVDSSTLLAFCAKCLGPDNVYAVFVNGAMTIKGSYEKARDFAQQINVSFEYIQTNPFEIPQFAENSLERCYFCKRSIFEKIKQAAQNWKKDCVVFDGTNVDDNNSKLIVRPGLRAIKELGIISPFVKCGMAKEHVRTLAKMMKLELWNSASQSCLATRFSYGTKLSENIFNAVDAAEKFILSFGIKTCRVRIHDLVLARIEVPRDQIKQFVSKADENFLNELQKILKPIGVKYITIDMKGFRSGSFDETR